MDETAADKALDKALRYRYLIFATLAASYMLVYFHRLCPAVVAVDMMEDLETTGGLLGLLGSAYFYPYALMQLPAGLLSDSAGPRRTIAIFFIVAFAGSVILGLADSVAAAIAGRLLVGLGVSMLFVPAMKILAEWFRAKEFAGMTGILVAMGGAGSITAARPLASLSEVVGWRGSFLIVGAVTLALAALVWLVVRDKPADKGLPSPVVHDDQPGEEGIGLWAGVKKVLGQWRFWPLALWFFFGCAVFFAYVGLWGGPYLQHVYGLTKEQAGNILTMSAFGMIVGSPLLGFVSNRLVKGRKPVLVFASAATLVVTGVLAFGTASIPVWGLYALTFFMGVFTNAIVVIGFTATKELFPVRISGTSTGLVNLFPFLGGALAQPLLGYILEQSGPGAGGVYGGEAYSSAFKVLFVCGALSLVSSLFVKETFTE